MDSNPQSPVDHASSPHSIHTQSSQANSRHHHHRSPILPKGTIGSGIINISNTILGSGMLAMPYAISSVGLGLGLILILLFAMTSAFSLWLLTHLARHIPNSESSSTRHVRTSSSFFALSKITYPNAAVYFDAAIAIKCFGVSCSYLVVIGDVMPVVMHGLLGDSVHDSIWGLRTWWIFMAVLLVTPLAFKPRLNSLRHTSSIALVAVFYLVGIVVFFFSSPNYTIVPGEVVFFKLSMDFFKTLPLFVFAFTCHQNIFPVYNEIHDNKQSNMNVVISASIFTSLVVYYIIGSLGYLMYGDKVAGNIINMYPAIPLVTYGRLALAILFAFSYPIQSHPCRTSIIQIITYFRTKKGNHSESVTPERRPLMLPISPSYASVEQEDPRIFDQCVPVPSPTNHSNLIQIPRHDGRNEVPESNNTWDNDDRLFYSVTTIIVLLSFIISVTIGSLDTVLSIVGATGSVTICYILPGLFYYRLYRDQQWTLIKLGAILMSLTGVCIMLCCVEVITLSSSDSDKDIHIHPKRPTQNSLAFSISSKSCSVLQASQILRSQPTESPDHAFHSFFPDLPTWILDLWRVIANPGPSQRNFRAQVHASLSGALVYISKCNNPQYWDLSHPGARFFLVALRLSILAISYAVAPPHNRPACHFSMDALSIHDDWNKVTLESKKRPAIHILADLIALDPRTCTFPPLIELESVIQTLQQAVAHPFWKLAGTRSQKIDTFPTHFTLESCMFLISIGARAERLHRHQISFSPQEYMFLDLLVKLPVPNSVQIHDNTTPKQCLEIALNHYGISNTDAVFNLFTSLNIYALSQRTQFTMLQILSLCHNYRCGHSCFLHPNELSPPPPLLIVWDGDNVVPSQKFLKELEAGKQWFNLHIHGLEKNQKNFQLFIGRNKVNIGTYHTVQREGAEAADFEALYQIVQNLTVLQRRVILLVSHDHSFGIMKLIIQELLGSVGLPATHPYILNALNHLSSSDANNVDIWPYLNEPTRPSVPLVARTPTEVKFWMTWARLCITGGDFGLERQYTYSGPRLCHFEEGVDMLDSDTNSDS